MKQFVGKTAAARLINKMPNSTKKIKYIKISF